MEGDRTKIIKIRNKKAERKTHTKQPKIKKKIKIIKKYKKENKKEDKKRHKFDYKKIHSVLTYKLGKVIGCINRDKNAVLNNERIIISLIKTGKRPEIFRRENKTLRANKLGKPGDAVEVHIVCQKK